MGRNGDRVMGRRSHSMSHEEYLKSAVGKPYSDQEG
jgi:hypothetical protein